MVVEAIEAERSLILTNPIAQKWMGHKTADLKRWLDGMRRRQRMGPPCRLLLVQMAA